MSKITSCNSYYKTFECLENSWFTSSTPLLHLPFMFIHYVIFKNVFFLEIWHNDIRIPIYGIQIPDEQVAIFLEFSYGIWMSIYGI